MTFLLLIVMLAAAMALTLFLGVGLVLDGGSSKGAQRCESISSRCFTPGARQSACGEG